MLTIKKAVVIGSGVMGSGIAAHLANCGIPSYLLDVIPPDLSKILKAKPPHLYDEKDIRLITPGLLDPNLEKLKECDWIIEAIPEKLELKKELYKKIAPYLKKEAWVSSNTSGLPLRELKFREKFSITHFFNPPRYLKLVEVIGEAPELTQFIEERLGKGVVKAKDTPNFIANRIGLFHIYDGFYICLEKGWPIEKVEAVMGPATCRPKSAMFRTCDLVGLDTLSFAAKTSYDGCPHDERRERLKNPPFLDEMLKRGWLGQKSGQGFYKVEPKEGQKEILALDLKTYEYRPQQKFKTSSLGIAKDIEDPALRLKTVVFAEDEAGQIAWPLISNMLVYAVNRIPEIADSIEEIDKAMRWGFNWELGPFEMWDALGVKEVVARLEKEGRPIPKLAQDILKKDGKFYSRPRLTFLQSKKESKKVIEKNDSASLVDLGDGVFCAEFHSKMNAIDPDIISMLHQGVERAEREGQGLVIANEGENFSVGANLLMILMAAQTKDWNQIDKIIREFQKTMQRIRFSKRPIVAAPFGFTFGGGCEICMASTQSQAAAETYIGLVEVGVGLLPAGGGCKNLLLNLESQFKERHKAADKIWFSPEDGGPFPKVGKAFETIAMAKVATSAKEAKKIGYLRRGDAITLDSDKLIPDAKTKVSELSKNYVPPPISEDIDLPGKGGETALINGALAFHKKGLISDYDLEIAKTVAHVLSGGDRPSVHKAAEQHILDLEREAFLKLCGEPKTIERMQHMLMTGKPLRN